MRILQIAPLWETVPPPAYGGTENVVHLLTEELVVRGYDVTLVASGDSQTSARHVSVRAESLRRAQDRIADCDPYDWAHTSEALARANGYDIVHNHAGELPMAFSRLIDTPMLTTMHCNLTPDTKFIWDRYEGAYNTISRSQAARIKIDGPARYVGHVYNAIDVDSFPFQAERGEDLLFLSRIAPEKGPHHAVAIAKRLGLRLILAGKVDRYDQRFFDEVMRDLIDGEQIVFVGEANGTRKRELYRSARCLLLPLMWEEPFGLVMPEAMACGTPVVALRRGAAPEIIAHGETGFVVDSVDEMADAVAETRRIDPRRCREHVARNFGPAAMTAGYIDVYERLAGRPRTVHVVAPAMQSALPSQGASSDNEGELAIA